MNLCGQSGKKNLLFQNAFCLIKNINLVVAKLTTFKAGNGALMRINPIPLVYINLTDLLKYSKESTIKCIKKAYNLSNELNKTNMLVVTKPME